MKSINIFVASHKPTLNRGDQNFKLLQVGASLHPDVHVEDAIKDNENKDNISSKNNIYCELTGLYYIWKSIENVDYVGLCHYRRYFAKKDIVTKHPEKYILSSEQMANDLQDYDIILPVKCRKNGTNKGFFTNPVDVQQFCTYRNIIPAIKDLYPDYVDSYYEEFFRNEMSYGNMMVCSKTLCNDYCKFLFDILFNSEKRWLNSGIDVAPREMGYISEYLLNTWVRKNKLKVKYYPVIFIADVNKLGFKVHNILQKLGLNNIIGPYLDIIYRKYITHKDY